MPKFGSPADASGGSDRDNHAEVARLDLGAFEASPPPGPWTDSEVLEQGQQLALRLPEEVQHVCASMKAKRGPVGLWLRGLPGPEVLPATPTRRPAAGALRTGAEVWLAAVATLLGELFAHAEICDGDWFHHIMPLPGQEDEPTGECSRAKLRMHTDGVSHPMPPDFVILWCHRGHHKVATRIASARALTRELPPEIVMRLAQPVFQHERDYEFGELGGQLASPEAKAILEADHIDVDVDFVHPPDTSDQQVLDCLEETAERIGQAVVLAPGDLLVIDNRRSIHGRDAFMAQYDGADRWLQAAYVRHSLVPPTDEVDIVDRVATIRSMVSRA